MIYCIFLSLALVSLFSTWILNLPESANENSEDMNVTSTDYQNASYS